jgi:uncharacterized membrane protein
LGRWLLLICSIDIVYLSAWQGLSPMTASITTQLESDGREHAYQQCSLPLSITAQRMFIASIVIKGIWLLVGVLLAFSTRSVSDQFNESKSIALAIYNVVFAVGLIAPIAALINAIGDTQIVLM